MKQNDLIAYIETEYKQFLEWKKKQDDQADYELIPNYLSQKPVGDVLFFFTILLASYEQEEIDLIKQLLSKYKAKEKEKLEKRRNTEQKISVKDGVLRTEDVI